MPITRTAMIDDDGTGTTGTIINNAWKQELYGQIDAYVAGTAILIPHAAGNYTASAGTWTVSAANQVTWQYAIVSKLAFFALVVASSTISAAPASLLVTLPAGVPLATANLSVAMPYYHAGGAGTGVAEISASNTVITLVRDLAGTPWTASAGNLFVRAEWFYPIA